jgi:FixJ family two-component response regulator
MLSPTVFVVADEPAVLDALTDLFKQAKLHSEIFESAESFLAQFDPERPGCMVLDMSLAGMGGAGLHRALIQRKAIIPVIILMNHSDARNAMEVMKGGAMDFFEKPFDGKALLGAVKFAARVDDVNRHFLRLRADVMNRFAQLTRRERQIMDIMLESKSSREIAGELNMSTRTVEFHRASIMKKMGAASLVDLVRMVAMAFECHCIHKHKYNHLQGVVLTPNALSPSSQPA